MTKQNLNGAKISRGLVNHGSLCSSEGVRAIILPSQTNCRDPFANQSSVLSRAKMFGGIAPAGKGIIINGSSPELKPSEETCSDLGRDLELYPMSSLLLNNRNRCSAPTWIILRKRCFAPTFRISVR